MNEPVAHKASTLNLQVVSTILFHFL